MRSVAYYLPGIPDNRSTTRYNHALAVADGADESLLITFPTKPPTEIATRFDRVIVLRSGGIISRAKEAKRHAEAFFADSVEEPLFLTTFHYAPALAGWLSNHTWVVDVYDDPHQKRYQNPRTVHELGVRCLVHLLRRADRGVHTVHPSTPHTYGRDEYFARNGAAVEVIQSDTNGSSSERLQAVCAGVKGTIDVLLQGISRVDAPIDVDVFGDITSADRQTSEELGLTDAVNFRGKCDHSEVIASIERSDVGFALMPRKPDWYYAHPIKIGEYLAAGTVPIASAYPGIRQLTRDSGMLVEYDSDAVAEALTELHERPELRDRLKMRCRQRAEAIDWREEREWFAKQALYGNNATKN